MKQEVEGDLGGKPYFAALEHPLNVRLVETKTSPGGVVLLRYEPGGV